jgi:hypothetical protein
MTRSPDDEFHPPADGDGTDWMETCWFTFTVPERRLSGQLYPFFHHGVAAAGAYFWDEHGDQVWNCRYAKNFWHLPFPTTPLSDLELANGIRYRCLEPGRRYHVRYDDPDTDELSVDLTFTGVAEAHRLGASHLDQPGRYQGTVRLHGETIEVDAYGFRDRSWGRRTQVGGTLQGSGAASGGYSYATASERDGFHAITMNFGDGCIGIHGHLVRDGVWAALKESRRTVVSVDPVTGFPAAVRLQGVDTLGRELDASGRCLNRLIFPINPNLLTVNCLTEWTFDGITAYGEDHDNWSAASIRAAARRHAGFDQPAGERA